MKLYILLPIAGLIITACASTYSAEDCPAVDWGQIGFDHAMAAQPLSVKTEASRKCAEFGVTADRAALTRGWEEGRATYCAPLTFFETSLTAEPALRFCLDPYDELADLAAIGAEHRRTMARFDQAETALESLHNEIKRREDKIADRRADIADLRLQLESASGAQKTEIENAIEKYRGQIAKHRREIAETRRDIPQAESALRVALPLADRSEAYVSTVREELASESAPIR